MRETCVKRRPNPPTVEVAVWSLDNSFAKFNNAMDGYTAVTSR